ncbi:unnamed protein product [Pleuronectes platessa]|uniref:Uncharacterized protein n=1 Tax=Pleuronectes platessa TaxID=8262 RepID=A0A9N7YDN9_PLEPL|nr:unnamed protein product [Pleuronectes platessa]
MCQAGQRPPSVSPRASQPCPSRRATRAEKKEAEKHGPGHPMESCMAVDSERRFVILSHMGKWEEKETLTFVVIKDQMAMLGSCRDTDTCRHERSESGMTSQTLVSSSSGYLPGAHNRSRRTQAGLREAREMLGLGTQELRP